MKLITYIILFMGIVACSEYKDKKGMIEKRLEMKDSLKTLHPDSVVKYKDKRLARKKNKKDCCAKCGCETNDNT